jgi:hypothetical protein
MEPDFYLICSLEYIEIEKYFLIIEDLLLENEEFSLNNE